MPKTPSGKVEIEAIEDVDSILHSVEKMPKVTRAQGTRSDSVRKLVDAIKDGETHYLAIKEDERDKWRRKLIYAGRVADMVPKTVFLRDETADGDPPGLYFQGKSKEEGRKRKAS